MPGVESITIDPDASRWRGLLERFAAPSSGARFREQLGLPTDSRVVMGGHQAGFWHPGVLAKLFAVVAAAEALDAVAAWLVVDHDTNTPDQIRYPVERDGLADAVWSVAPAIEDRATGRRAGVQPSDPDPGRSAPFVADGLARMRGALSAAAAGDLAGQFQDAAIRLAGDVEVIAVRSSELAKTDLFRELLRDADAVHRSYNDAVARDDAFRALTIDDRGPELPAWRFNDDGVRESLFATELASTNSSDLAPRALLMTGLIRYAGCDLFVHGTGGGDDDGYDRITQTWFHDLLGAKLAPSVVVTADVLLPIDDDTPTEAQIERAKWLAHNAKHNPALLDDHDSASAKEQILARAEQAKAAKQNPASIFAELQTLLAGYRERHADRLSALVDEAERLESRRDAARLAHDRTWAFPLHPTGSIDELRARIDAAFGVATIARAT